VYDAVRLIPTCRVTTYGHIAKMIGMPRHSRHIHNNERVYEALKFISPNAHPMVPWHRVIGSSGTISSRGPGTDGAQRQRDALVAEGVEVTVGRTGELRVALTQWGWFPQPNSLPSAADDQDSVIDSEEET
ncbi:uncharacterized protein LACBIDRAFT_148929, partial [Laccaria bicolor S238N-H82]